MKYSFISKKHLSISTTAFPVILGTLLLVANVNAAEHTKDSIPTIKQKISDDKAVLLDVREQREWDEGHLKAAKLIPLSDLREGISKKELEKLLPKNQIVYTHCRSGRRCLAAADILKKYGYDVRALKEGYQDLLSAGFEKAE